MTQVHLALAVAGMSAAAVVAAQRPQRPVFEVASVKANRSGAVQRGSRSQGDQFTATNLPLRLLIQQAYNIDAGRPVVNKTGFTGAFDWDLTWTPQTFLQGPFNRERFPTIDPDGLSIFTAVQEQLGLKLESQKGEGEVLVIDGVEHPTED